jgi:hypothetical protein
MAEILCSKSTRNHRTQGATSYPCPDNNGWAQGTAKCVNQEWARRLDIEVFGKGSRG